MMNAASNATDDDDEEVTIVREPRDGLGRHTRRRGREEASSPTERDGSERFSDVDVGNGHGTALPPPLQRPQAGTTPWRGCTVIRETARGNRHFMHTGRSCNPCRAEASTHRERSKRAPATVCCADRHRRWRRLHDASASTWRNGNTHTRKRTALFLLFLVSFFFVFLGFLQLPRFLFLFFVLFFCFSPPVCFCFVLFCFCFCFGWALDTHAMDTRFHKNERRQRRREEPSGGSVEARPRAHDGAMANQSTTDELRSHGITVSAYPATSATQRRERCERECCSSSAGTRRLGETVERPVGKRRVVSTRVECSKGTRHSNRERA